MQCFLPLKQVGSQIWSCKCENGQGTPFFLFLFFTIWQLQDQMRVRWAATPLTQHPQLLFSFSASAPSVIICPSHLQQQFAWAAVQPFEAKQALSDFQQRFLPSCLASVQGAGFFSRDPCRDVPDVFEKWKMLVPASCAKELLVQCNPLWGALRGINSPSLPPHNLD